MEKIAETTVEHISNKVSNTDRKGRTTEKKKQPHYIQPDRSSKQQSGREKREMTQRSAKLSLLKEDYLKNY